MDLNATILGQTISFIIFIWFCMKYIWPKLIIIIKKRKKFIEEKLSNIKQTEQDIQIMHNQAKKIISSSKKKAMNIIKLAHADKIIILEQAQLHANKKKKKILKQAILEIQIQEVQLRKKLKEEVSKLASMIANKIIINTIQKHKQPNIENLIKNL